MNLSPLSAAQTLTQSLLPRAASATSPTTSGSASTSSQSGTDNIGSTFLSLLVQELQNQDPTAPMDSTAMVGQMISLNQLDQLTSINQTLTDNVGSSTSTAGTTSSGTATGHLSSTAANAQTATQTAVQTALRLLNNNSIHAAALPSVSLPAF